MKASSQVVLIADSLFYDDPSVKVDSVKESVLLFNIDITYIIFHLILTSYIFTNKVADFSIL